MSPVASGCHSRVSAQESHSRDGKVLHLLIAEQIFCLKITADMVERIVHLLMAQQIFCLIIILILLIT